MDSIHDFDFDKIPAVAVRLLEGTLSPAEQQEFESLLLENGAARRAYLEYVQESAILRWLCVEEFDEAEPVALPSHPMKSKASRWRTAAIATGSLLASVLVLVIGLQFIGRGDGRAPQNAASLKSTPIVASAPSASTGSELSVSPLTPSTLAEKRDLPGVATTTALDAAHWIAPMTGTKILSRWAVGDRLQLGGGSAELTFDAGVQVTVFGPAEFEITSPTSIRCLRGRITTLVDKRGRGFTIQTPGAKVVDLGTQFGLSISDEGETEVVVFQGSVDLTSGKQPKVGDAPSRRMRQGEALKVKRSGEFERIISVERNSFLDAGERRRRRPAEPVIADVRDNIRNEQGLKSYQIVRGGLEDDALAFVDRNHEWNGLDETGLPVFLAGADYIMPFNGDKFVRSLELKVTLLRPATLYLFVDDNMQVPDWMRDEFTDTGVDIGLDCSKTEWHVDHSLGVGSGKKIDFKFSVWKREIGQPGTVTLGGVEPPKDRTQGFNMYGIAAVPRL